MLTFNNVKRGQIIIDLENKQWRIKQRRKAWTWQTGEVTKAIVMENVYFRRERRVIHPCKLEEYTKTAPKKLHNDVILIKRGVA